MVENRDSNLIIQSLWVGEALSLMEQMCIRSYLQKKHEFHLYTYDYVSNIPEGTTICDANEIVPRNEIYLDSFGGYVNLSNQFRYALLYQVGGWWVDMDTVCLKPFDFKEPFVFSSESSDPYKRFMVNTTFVKSVPGAGFLKDCLDFLRRRGHSHIHWGELGVNLISRMILRNDLGLYIKPPITFCPISPYQVKHFVGPSSYRVANETYALHWWNEVWKNAGIDKNLPAHEGSLYEKMKSHYLESKP